MLYNALQSNKHIWIKKATGLGVTEFMLRYMAWLCLKDVTYRNAQMPIVCNQDIAIKLIKRIRRGELELSQLGRRKMMIMMVLRKGQYITTAEHRKHLSKVIKKWWSKPENRELMSKAHSGPGHSGGKGWHQTKEAKEKIRQARLGKPHPYKRNPERGWKISEQGIKNMSKARKRFWSTLKKENPGRYKEIRKRMSEGQKRRHSNKKG